MDRSAVVTTSSAVAIALSTLATAGSTIPPRIDTRHFSSLRAGDVHLWVGGAMTETSGERIVVLSEPSQSSTAAEDEADLVSLTEADFAVLTEADIAMLESAVSAEPDDLDYSAFYINDDD